MQNVVIQHNWRRRKLKFEARKCPENLAVKFGGRKCPENLAVFSRLHLTRDQGIARVKDNNDQRYWEKHWHQKYVMMSEPVKEHCWQGWINIAVNNILVIILFLCQWFGQNIVLIHTFVSNSKDKYCTDNKNHPCLSLPLEKIILFLNYKKNIIYF